MAQQDTRTEAVQQISTDRCNFLKYTDRRGSKWNFAPLGSDAIEHTVLVFQEPNGIPGFPVVLSVKTSGFGLQEYLTPDEARTLAKALTLAADHAEQQQAQAEQDATTEAEVAA